METLLQGTEPSDKVPVPCHWAVTPPIRVPTPTPDLGTGDRGWGSHPRFVGHRGSTHTPTPTPDLSGIGCPSPPLPPICRGSGIQLGTIEYAKGVGPGRLLRPQCLILRLIVQPIKLINLPEGRQCHAPCRINLNSIKRNSLSDICQWHSCSMTRTQGTEPPIPIPIPIPDLSGDGDGGPIPDFPSPICRGSGVHPHPHPRFARIGDQAEYH
jgi:hypothetical protein